MPLVQINYYAVLAAAVASMVLGFVWYGLVFAKAWMKAAGKTEADIMEAKKKGMGKTYFVAFVSALVTAYVLAYLVGALNAATAFAGAIVGFWSWLGFVATSTLDDVLFDKKPFALYRINAFYYLVNLALMGVILAVWK